MAPWKNEIGQSDYNPDLTTEENLQNGATEEDSDLVASFIEREMDKTSVDAGALEIDDE